MKQVAEELGVNYVLEGSVRRTDGRVRITAQLNDMATGSHIWAERYDRDLADVFAVQDEITDAIVAAIEPQIYAAENLRSRRKPPDRLDGTSLLPFAAIIGGRNHLALHEIPVLGLVAGVALAVVLYWFHPLLFG